MPDNRLPTNQSQLDIVNKLDEIKDAIAQGGGGGGGTGGHTIIDENGNSMTARAGLQFIGGANVSDDATNNKTIVDLASAGGIDGVFIDTNNVIKSSTNFRSSLTYTATEDCAFCLYLVTQGNTSAQVRIDGIVIIDYWKSSMDTPSFPPIFLKKGQILSIANANASYDSTYRVYGIQTGTTHSKFQPVIYSFEEREIGVWTDGKPLYQKTFIVNPTQATETIDISSLHIDKMVSRNTTCTRDTGGSGLQQKDVQYRSESVGSDTYGLICEIRGTDLYFDISGYNYSQITEIRATLQYTKTTDVAGSGTWTPQGVPTHHYSTDEQVIGTWMGETLWKKTYDFSSNPISIPSGSNFMTSDIDSSNMGVVTNVFANHSDGTLYNDMSADPTGSNHTKLKLKSVGGATAYYLTLQYTKTS